MISLHFTVVACKFLSDSQIVVNHIQSTQTLHFSRRTNRCWCHSHCWAISCWLLSSARLSGIGWRQQVHMRWQPWGGQRYSWGAAGRKEVLDKSQDVLANQEKCCCCAKVGFNDHCLTTQSSLFNAFGIRVPTAKTPIYVVTRWHL